MCLCLQCQDSGFDQEVSGRRIRLLYFEKPKRLCQTEENVNTVLCLIRYTREVRIVWGLIARSVLAVPCGIVRGLEPRIIFFEWAIESRCYL
jgi:hypothetical protein